MQGYTLVIRKVRAVFFTRVRNGRRNMGRLEQLYPPSPQQPLVEDRRRWKNCRDRRESLYQAKEQGRPCTSSSVDF